MFRRSTIPAQRLMPGRRLVAAATAAIAATVTLTACAGTHTTAGAGGGGAAASLSMTSQAACDAAAAKDGGTLNYWTSTDAAVFKQEMAAFNAKYPKIHVNYTSLRPADQVQRIVSEVQAHHDLDVDAIAGDLPSFAPLFDQKLIEPVDWTKLGIPADIQFQLKGYTTIRTYREVLGLGYNSKLVQASDLPDTWQGLVNSKWAGKAIVDPRGVYLSGLALGMGQDAAVTWFKSLLSTNKPMIVQGATASMQKVISGEALLTTSSHDAEAAEQQGKGAPIGIKYLDIVPTQDWYALVLKGAAHPEAAACFFSWWTGPEAQALQLKYEFKTNKTTPDGIPAGAKLVAINDPDQAKVATDTASAFAKLMAG